VPIQGDNESSRTFLNTKIGDNSFFVNMSWVQSIERTDNLTKQPGNNNIIGSLTFERANIDVYSISDLLEIKPEDQDIMTERVVIIRKENMRIGLLVNSVSGIVEIQSDLVFDVPSIANSSLSNLFESIAISDNDLYLSISPDFLSAQKEQLSHLEDDKASDLITKSPAHQNGDATGGAGSNQILIFKILDSNAEMSKYLFGMSISQVLQILEPQEIIGVPGSLDFVYGLINWRNRPVPVIDLYKRMGLKDSQINDQTRFVVARTLSKGLIICFPVYFDVNVVKLPLPHEKLVLDSEIDMSFTKGTFKVEDYTLVIPDLDKVVFKKIENLN